MINFYERLSHKQQGLLLVLVGSILLLNTTGLVEKGLDIIIIIIAIAMILHGFIKVRVYNWIMNLINKDDQ